MTLFGMTVAACGQRERPFRVYAWMSGKVDMPDEALENYFSRAAASGISGIFLECHGGYPAILGDSTSFRDSAALLILRRAVPYAKKYGLELHAWMWTTNRCEETLLKAHPEWYEVNGLGESLADIEMYHRKHYRFLCPNHEGVAEYLKDRVRELAEVEGLTGIHLDFIRYPDAILPYGLHASRGVVQDKVYPQWDCCYCDQCRAAFKAQTGIDPLELEDPTACQQWMQFRWDAMAALADGLLAEIRSCGKVASAAVFATPEESRKLVRQDWVQFCSADALLPMIYYDAYAQPREWVETATREGVEGLAAAGNKAAFYSGVPVPRDGNFAQCIDLARSGGADGICFFSLEVFSRRPELWEVLREAVAAVR
ncbi:MAG: hypothetical protein IJ636_03175 [Bacteroidales bacterium]|nr:hypothetical protein [Bacteroidales bacterium]